MVQRFVVRTDGVNERRAFPLRLRNALRRLFANAVERTALRDAAPFLAAAKPDQPPPTDRVSLLTTPRFNHLAFYIPANAPPSQQIAINDFLIRWSTAASLNGYSVDATDPQWKVYMSVRTTASEMVVIAYFGSNQLFSYNLEYDNQSGI